MTSKRFVCDFFNHPEEIPGFILEDIAEFPSQFKDEKWYSSEEIYDLSGAFFSNIWLDPDNPTCIIYLDFQPYDHHCVCRELIKIHIFALKREYIIYDSPYSREELDERFLYSRLFLGYDYQSDVNKCGVKYFNILPVKDNVLSLKKLCIRNIKLLIAEKLDLIKKINKSEIILKPLTLRCNSRQEGYCKWNPKIIDFHERFLHNQPEYIKNMLELYEF